MKIHIKSLKIKPENAITVLSEFISRIIVANIVTLENVKEIYEIVVISSLFKGEKDNCSALLEKCEKTIVGYFEKYHLYSIPDYTKEKIAELEKQLNVHTIS